MLGGFSQTGASFYHFMCVFSHSPLIRASLKLTVHITSLTIIYSGCADSIRSLPHPLSFLSSSPVLLNVGVGSAVLEVGVGVIGALPAEFTATTLMV